MRFSFKKLIGLIILLIFIIFFSYYFYINIESFRQLNVENWEYIIIIAFLFTTALFFNGLFMRSLLKPFKIKIKIFEAFGISIITRFYNTITPFRGGAGVRAIYLRKKYNFSYSHFLSTLSATYVINIFISSILGLITLGLIYNYQNFFNLILFLIFLSLFLVTLSIILFSPKFSERNNPLINKFIKMINGWYLIRKDRKIIFATSFFYLIQLLLGALSLYLQFKVFGLNINFISSLFLVSIAYLGFLVAITPANLGINEAIIVFSASVIGITITESLSAAILGRVVSLLVLFVLGPIFSYILLKHKPNKEKKQNDI
jgi:uncharacterized protein (TIRG00374 family)